MTKGIDRFVSENRRDVRRIDSTFVEVSSQRRRQFDFGQIGIPVEMDVKVYTRPLNDSLISGHPAAKHGSGRGVSGDQRGSWTLQQDGKSTGMLVKEGRQIMRDSLAGITGTRIDKIKVGDGVLGAQPDDQSLQSETGATEGWGEEGASSNISIAAGGFRFQKGGDGDVSEYGVTVDDGRLYTRLTTDAVDVDYESEIKVEVDFTVESVENRAFTYTDDGRDALAETVRDGGTIIGFNKYKFGDDGTAPTTSQTDLGNGLFEKGLEQITEPESVTTHTVVIENEPSSQPVTIREIGLFDNSDRMMYRVVIDDYTKKDDREFEVFANFRAK